MTRVDDLIAELCPNGVRHTAIGEIGRVVRGKRFVKADMQSEGVPCLHYGEIYTRYGVKATESFSFVSEERSKTLRFAQPGDVIIAATGETVDDIGKSVAWLGSKPIAIHDACYAFTSSLDPVFASYLFASTSFRDQIRRYVSSSKISSISTQDFSKARIPVPPIEVQLEVVRVLDKFTHLVEELEAELEARRIQYAYLRGEAFERARHGPYVTSTVGDVCVTVSSGGTPRSSNANYYDGGIPWVRTQEVDFNEIWTTSATISEAGLANSSAKWIPENCVIVAMYGATAAKVAVNRIPVTTNQACCNLQIDPAVAHYRYVFHWLSNNYLKLKSLGEGSQSNLNAAKVRRFPIELPSLAVQKETAGRLDTLDALVSDISQGLPAEIAARRKQYEYYRDKLLTFRDVA